MIHISLTVNVVYFITYAIYSYHRTSDWLSKEGWLKETLSQFNVFLKII